MARNSKNSQQNYLAATSLSPKRPSSKLSPQDLLIETKLRIEQAKLAKLEAELPKDEPKYTRWEDMPPPTPEDEARFAERFNTLINNLRAEGSGPDAGQTVQDWLIEQGAVIPDLPEWKTPLYLEKFWLGGKKPQRQTEF
jgi:broad specificity phosphatase PhoE